MPMKLFALATACTILFLASGLRFESETSNDKCPVTQDCTVIMAPPEDIMAPPEEPDD